jgi:hypothetical protein
MLLIPLAVIGVLSDVPLSQIIVTIWKPDHAILVHMICLFLAAWGLVWIVGDRFAVRELTHVVNAHQIFLNVGFRWSCVIPVHSIVRCTALCDRPRDWLPRLSIGKDDVWFVTPVDSPNVLMEIDATTVEQSAIKKMGARVPGRQFVALYVDDPQRFISETQSFVQHRKDPVDA